MTPEILTLLMFAGIIAGVLLGFPIAFTFAGTALIVGLIGWGGPAILMINYRANEVLFNFQYVTMPLFIFMGCMMQTSGIADSAFETMSQWLRKVRGGLGIATVVICMLFASCIGVINASVTTLGLIALAPMIDRGYSKSLAGGIVAAGGGLGVLLPPSIVMIIFGPLAKVSISKLFVASIIPGLLLGLFYAVYIGAIGYFKKNEVPAALKNDDMPLKYNLRQGFISLIPFVALIFLVIGAISFGIATPTEVAAVGALGSIVIAALNKKCSVKILLDAAMNTLRVSTMVVFIAIGASMFTAVLFAIGGSRVIRGIIENLNIGPGGTLALALLLVFVLGIFMDWLGVIMILVPIYMPILVDLGFNPIHVSVVTLLLLQTSFLTPPIAQSVFFLMGVAPPSVEIADVYKGVIPFICIQILVVIICIVFPSLITFLPDLNLSVTLYPETVSNPGLKY